MPTVTVSPKFQVVIPKEVREHLSLKPGHKLHVMAYGSRIELVPVRPPKELRGFLKGMKSNFEREKDRL